MTEAEHERRRRFEDLYRRHLADMAAYCGWRAGSAADAQDAVAEVFLVAWRRFEQIPPGHEARAWLYATARRIMANQARAGRRRTLLQGRLSAVPPAIAGGDPQGAATGEAGDAEVDVVRVALRTLKPADQEILLLAEWEELSPAEIARVMGCPAVTTRGRLHRARRRFRTAFEAAATEAGLNSLRRPDDDSAPLVSPLMTQRSM